jgi:uncharacterized protein (TIGR03085 family)
LSDFAQVERAAFVEAARAAGPDGATLCEGWTVADLVAHVLLRERRPLAGLGIVVPPLRPYTNSVQGRLKKKNEFSDLLRKVENGPPLLARAIDEVMNTMEFFIHTEDIRRAAPQYADRFVEPREEKMIFGRLRFLAKMGKRHSAIPFVLEAENFGRIVGKDGETAVIISGLPSELCLYMSGRQQVAKVNVAGPNEAIAALHDARFGF